MRDTIVRTCPGCVRQFTLQELAESPDIDPIGMQLLDSDAELSVYYFNHLCPSCGSTFMVSVKVFFSLIDEPIPETIQTGTELCGGHCLSIDDLTACQAPCFYAPFRRLLLNMRMHIARAKRRKVVTAGTSGDSVMGRSSE